MVQQEIAFDALCGQRRISGVHRKLMMNFADKLSDFEFVPTQGNLSDYVRPKTNILRHAYGRNKVFGLYRYGKLQNL